MSEQESIPTLEELAESLDFETAEQAAEYVYASRVNGQHKQARKLFADLDLFNKRECIEHLRAIHGDGVVLEAVTDWLDTTARRV